MSDALIQIRGLKMHFPVGGGGIFRRQSEVVHAVDGIDLDIYRGETLGLVGESGCGKSTMGRAILQLHRPTSGQVIFDGVDLVTVKERRLRSYRRKLQIIFQDPYASLNPRMTVGSIIGEPLREHKLVPRKDVMSRVRELMELVGLDPSFVLRYPHEFSGGQRQRIGIARALAVQPDFIVCDEPVSALDVSIQAQVINLLQDLQEKLGLTYLFIAHDLAAVRHISNRIAVMYLGQIVEIAPAAQIYERPRHPYTKALVSAVPIPDPRVESKRQRILLEGDVPSPIDPPKGCRFHTRCAFAKDRCRQEEPVLRSVNSDSDDHKGACHFIEELSAS
jgi:oligopeptide transport system ATP-binding protein